MAVFLRGSECVIVDGVYRLNATIVDSELKVQSNCLDRSGIILMHRDIRLIIDSIEGRTHDHIHVRFTSAKGTKISLFYCHTIVNIVQSDCIDSSIHVPASRYHQFIRMLEDAYLILTH